MKPEENALSLQSFLWPVGDNSIRWKIESELKHEVRRYTKLCAVSDCEKNPYVQLFTNFLYNAMR